MEEKKSIKISLSTFLLIIAIIVMIVMGYFLYNTISNETDLLSNEKELNVKIDQLEAEIANMETNNSASTQTNTTENSTSTSQPSFSEMMDMLYTKNETQIDGNACNNSPKDSVYMVLEDASQNVTDVEYTTVGLYDGELFFNMHTANSTDISTSISGISEEVVSIKIVPSEEGAIPLAVYFLTRDGNVYYIDDSMINSNDFVAQRLENLSEIVSIEVVNITYTGAMHQSTTLVATTFNGEKIDVLN